MEVGCGEAKPSGGLAKGESEVFLFCFLQVWRGADRLTVMVVATLQNVQCMGDLSSSYSSNLGSCWQIYSMMNAWHGNNACDGQVGPSPMKDSESEFGNSRF